MTKDNIKRLAAAFLACLGIGVFAIAGCNVRGGNNDEPDKGLEDNGDRQGGHDNNMGKPVRPETQSGYVKTYISADYVKNRNFYNYISEMPDYTNNSEIVKNAVYASPNGTGNGTSKADTTDIQTALDRAKAGQTIYLTGGTYELDESVWVEKSGKENGYITIRNYPGETPTITASAAAVAKNKEFPVFALNENVGYIVFEGLEICNVKTETAIGIAAYDGGQHNIIVRNNKFHNLETKKPNDADCGANAILLFGEKNSPMNNWLIYGNECYDNVLG